MIFGGAVSLFSGERLWPAPLEVEEGKLTSVAFGPGGKIATTYRSFGSRGGVLFDSDPDLWLRKAGERVGRNFTRLEWTRYFPKTAYRRTIRSLPWPHDLSDDERKEAETWEMEHVAAGSSLRLSRTVSRR